MLAAVAQLCSGPTLASNLSQCLSVIQRAAQSGAKLIWLPEASDFIAPREDVSRLAQPLDGSFVQSIIEEASRSSIWVGVGVHEKGDKADGRCFNTNVLINPASGGRIERAYRKIHLFDVDIAGGVTILESSTTIPGSELLAPATTPVGAVGLLTCYDIRFPEVSLALRRRGAQILTYPSAFTMRTGAGHWEVLLRARAIETQSYVLAPAQTGSHSSTRSSYGHSMIVNPWGEVIAQSSDVLPSHPGGEHDGTFVLGEINLDWLEKIRREMPLWEQRREDVYPLL